MYVFVYIISFSGWMLSNLETVNTAFANVPTYQFLKMKRAVYRNIIMNYHLHLNPFARVKFVWSNFSLMSVISFVLNFWVKLILGVFIKFVLIKIKNVSFNRQKKLSRLTLSFLWLLCPLASKRNANIWPSSNINPFGVTLLRLGSNSIPRTSWTCGMVVVNSALCLERYSYWFLRGNGALCAWTFWMTVLPTHLGIFGLTPTSWSRMLLSCGLVW